MIAQATVIQILEVLDDVQRLQVCLDSNSKDEEKAFLQALNYLALGPQVTVGQRVLVNTVGIDLDLGTGGLAFVLPAEDYEQNTEYGHVVKLRYTPLQIAVDTAEEQNSPYHELLSEAYTLMGMPVVCCELHSQIALVAAAIKHKSPQARCAFIMNDAASLPLALSHLVREACATGLLDCTISCGQAFGGEYEAVTVHSALLTALSVCKADVAIVAPGPGVVGTGTPFGHSGIAQGEALNAVNSLKGRPIMPLRLSWQDERARHEGLSHHSQTVLSQVCLAPVAAPVPAMLSSDRQKLLSKQLCLCTGKVQHDFLEIASDYDAIDLRGITVRTMGRGRLEDPEFFAAAFAAGILAAQMLSEIV